MPCGNPQLSNLANHTLPRHHLLHLTHETLTLISVTMFPSLDHRQPWISPATTASPSPSWCLQVCTRASTAPSFILAGNRSTTVQSSSSRTYLPDSNLQQHRLHLLRNAPPPRSLVVEICTKKLRATLQPSFSTIACIWTRNAVPPAATTNQIFTHHTQLHPSPENAQAVANHHQAGPPHCQPWKHNSRHEKLTFILRQKP